MTVHDLIDMVCDHHSYHPMRVITKESDEVESQLGPFTTHSRGFFRKGYAQQARKHGRRGAYGLAGDNPRSIRSGMEGHGLVSP